MRGKNGVKKITPEQVQQVKDRIKRGQSIRAAAMYSGVSYYTAWHINKGTYDTNAPLQPGQSMRCFRHNHKLFI